MPRFIAKDYKTANARYKQGYNTSLKDLSDFLNVSDRWLMTNIVSHINYTVYALCKTDYIKWHKEGKTNGTYVNLDDVNNFIIKKVLEKEYFFESQTEIIDLYSYLEGKPTNKKKVLELYNKYFDIDKIGFGRLPKEVIRFIDENYYKGKLDNINPKNKYKKDEDGITILSGRNSFDYPWIKVEPVNIFNDKYYLYFPKKDLIINDLKGVTRLISSGEHIHRFAFIHGHIRLVLGKNKNNKSNKVIYIGKKQEDYLKYKIPYTIKRNQSMSRY